MATTAATPFVELRLDQLTENPRNPRRHFDPQKLAELAESISEKGIIEPLVVRPSGGDGFELVAGARRYRAAQQAGLETVPCVVRDLDDVAALEIAIVENEQREDLTDIEAAEGYRALQELARERGQELGVDELCAKTGLSRSTIYNRLKLLELVPIGQDLVRHGILNPSIAQLVARVTGHDVQREVLEDVFHFAGRGVRNKGKLEDLLKPAPEPPPRKKDETEAEYEDRLFEWEDENAFHEPRSYREAKDLIGRRFTYKLANAIFPTDDAELVKAAGPCGTCPKRTGCQAELFQELTRDADVCTDPTCWQAKTEAFGAREMERITAGGGKVLSAAQAKKLFPWEYSPTNVDNRHLPKGLVDLDSEIRDPRTYRTIGVRRKLMADEGKDLKVTVVQNPYTGQVHTFVDRKESDAILRKRGKLKAGASSDRSSGSGLTPAQKAERRHKKVRKELEPRVLAKLYEAFKQAVKAKQATDGVLNVVAEHLVQRTRWAHAEQLVRLLHPELPDKQGNRNWQEALEAECKELVGEDRLLMILMLVAVHHTIEGYHGPDLEPEFVQLAKAYGVDAAKMQREARAGGDAKAKSAAAKRGAAARKKKAASKKRPAKKKATRTPRKKRTTKRRARR